ncbi:unnamed protein product, partial [Mesorhabditis belari]|uniref:SH3 domain-containing protein n=1 Tax=Mesorhabditis belari TaxID=2138241 RepID=A0AAF3EAZ4_9BILA
MAENFSEIILGERRKSTLKRIASLLDRELRAIYNKKQSTAVSRELTNIEFVEFLYYKINEALNSAEGSGGRGFHRLAGYLQKSKDKQGLSHSSLVIPLSDPLLSTESTSPGCFEDRNDDYDKSTDNGDSAQTTSFLGNPPSTSGSETYTLEAVKMESYPETVLPPKLGIGFKEEHLIRQSTVIDDPDPSLSICQALYDFNGTHQEELSIKAGENLIVESRLGDDWLVGRAMDGIEERKGRFPTIYVTFLTSSPTL